MQNLNVNFTHLSLKFSLKIVKTPSGGLSEFPGRIVGKCIEVFDSLGLGQGHQGRVNRVGVLVLLDQEIGRSDWKRNNLIQL